jgi:uncharacterized protein
MPMIESIGEDIKSAMKARDKVRLETLRSIKKVLLEKTISVRPSGQTELTPEQEIEAVSQIAKQRRDAIEQYNNVGRPDAAALEASELAIIEEFLPAQVSDTEIATIVAEIATELGITTAKEMGKVMGPVMQRLKGQADGKKVQAAVKAHLGGS